MFLLNGNLVPRHSGNDTKRILFPEMALVGRDLLLLDLRVFAHPSALSADIYLLEREFK
jgi:hypothetical protein